MAYDRVVRILIVEDDPDQLAVCKAMLQQGFPSGRLLCARTGSECLSFVEAGATDIVVLDYKLPGLTGIEVLRQVRGIAPDLPVVLVTGYGDEAVAVEAMKLGASDYVMKSLDYARILPSVVSRCLDACERERALEAERTRNIQLATVVQTTRALAHEINNPLQVISGTCELLSVALAQRDPALASQAAELVEVCERIADVIRRLYNVTNPVCQTRLGMPMLDIEASSIAPSSKVPLQAT